MPKRKSTPKQKLPTAQSDDSLRFLTVHTTGKNTVTGDFQITPSLDEAKSVTVTKQTAKDRRNLFTHNAGVVNSRYISKCSTYGIDIGKVKLGDALEVDRQYFRNAIATIHVVEMKTMIRFHVPTSCPAQDILRLALGRIPRFVT